MSKQELKDILNLHQKWLNKEVGGQRANLSGADLTRANLYNANLSYANLSDANLSYANLSGANLTGADLTGANLARANLSGADLTRANLYNANLSGADLSGANLARANLTGANLARANLYNANLMTFQYEKHFAYSTEDGNITIGCKTFPIKIWLEKFKEIGNTENYSELQIKVYGTFIKLCSKVYEAKQKEEEGKTK